MVLVLFSVFVVAAVFVVADVSVIAAVFVAAVAVAVVVVCVGVAGDISLSTLDALTSSLPSVVFLLAILIVLDTTVDLVAVQPLAYPPSCNVCMFVKASVFFKLLDPFSSTESSIPNILTTVFLIFVLATPVIDDSVVAVTV